MECKFTPLKHEAGKVLHFRVAFTSSVLHFAFSVLCFALQNMHFSEIIFLWNKHLCVLEFVWIFMIMEVRKQKRKSYFCKSNIFPPKITQKYVMLHEMNVMLQKSVFIYFIILTVCRSSKFFLMIL